VSQARLKKIKLLLLDVDGVMTDGRIAVDEKGNRVKVFCVFDGSGIRYLLRAGLDCAIITAHDFRGIDAIARELGVTSVFKNEKQKLPVYLKLLQKKKLADDEICFMGDDLVDIPVLRRVGFAVTVPGAPGEVKECVHFVTKKPGGGGAIREVVEKILKAQNLWEKILSRYLDAL
jgi:3-deoxy-D-manno-octulosonate 8-phosphate phosphatase (KDO 8-P phosphatase)